MKSNHPRIAIITGASAGIGEALTRKLIASGFAVVGNARREEKLTKLKEELGVAFHPVAGDASDESVINKLFNEAKEVFGNEADIVIANAGRGLGGSVTSADLSQFEEIVKLNLTGTVKLLQIAANRMIEDLSLRPFPQHPHDIVVLGSTVGRHVSPFSAVYGSTKFAVHGITEGLRREIGPKGIRVSLIEPGVVLSEFQDGAGYSKDTVDGFKSKFGPLLVGEDVSRTVDFIIQQPPHVHMSDILIRATRQDYP